MVAAFLRHALGVLDTIVDASHDLVLITIHRPDFRPDRQHRAPLTTIATRRLLLRRLRLRPHLASSTRRPPLNTSTSAPTTSVSSSRPTRRTSVHPLHAPAIDIHGDTQTTSMACASLTDGARDRLGRPLSRRLYLKSSVPSNMLHRPDRQDVHR